MDLVMQEQFILNYLDRYGGWVDWVDVEWHVGIGCSYRARARTRDVIPLNAFLNDVIGGCAE